jgi:hypothetical protein
MNIAYRTYQSRPDNGRISPITTYQFMDVLKRQQAIPRYHNQTIQLLEAQVVSEKDKSEVLRSIKIWDVTLDELGLVKNKTVNHLSTADIESIEQEMKLKDCDELVQNYINVLLGEDETESAQATETINNRIWTIFKALNASQQAA